MHVAGVYVVGQSKVGSESFLYGEGPQTAIPRSFSQAPSREVNTSFRPFFPLLFLPFSMNKDLSLLPPPQVQHIFL